LNKFYHAPGCGCAEHEPVQLVDFNGPINDESFIKKVFEGALKNGDVYPDYYFNVAKKLSEAVAKGLGGDAFKATDYRNTLKAYLEHNIFAFSAAKSLAALDAYKSKLTDDKGEPVSYGKFRDAVTDVDVEFNDTHLQTEYNSATATAQMADKWEKLQQHEYLEYRTVGDDRVRIAHRKLDGKVFAKDDPIWDKIYPPNDWNCRCTVIPAADGAKSDNYDEVAGPINTIPPYFQRNAGKSKVVYSADHPLFQKMNAQGLKVSELSATKNYNMRSIESIYRVPAALPEIKPMTKAAAETWFTKKAQKGVIDVQTKDGLAVQLDESFFNKMIVNTNPEYSDRAGYAHKATEVMQNPDEVWSQFHKGKLQTAYIKYYQDKPYMAAVKENNGKMEFETFHRVDQNGVIEQKRSGVLKYRK
jgi:SPP1 gp7 family putative phage head morphogenesis protein